MASINLSTNTPSAGIRRHYIDLLNGGSSQAERNASFAAAIAPQVAAEEDIYIVDEGTSAGIWTHRNGDVVGVYADPKEPITDAHGHAIQNLSGIYHFAQPSPPANTDQGRFNGATWLETRDWDDAPHLPTWDRRMYSGGGNEIYSDHKEWTWDGTLNVWRSMRPVVIGSYMHRGIVTADERHSLCCFPTQRPTWDGFMAKWRFDVYTSNTDNTTANGVQFRIRYISPGVNSGTATSSTYTLSGNVGTGNETHRGGRLILENSFGSKSYGAILEMNLEGAGPSNQFDLAAYTEIYAVRD